MRTDQPTITLAETKSRCAFYGYSVKKECGEFRAYPKGKPELDLFDSEGWPLFQTVRANAIACFKSDTAKLELSDELRDALVDWFAARGAEWLKDLYQAWCSGNYRGFKDSHLLQRFRNTDGYEKLSVFNR